ncbi:MAG TPA: sulfite exporter TauE/SafE family protein [Gemmatimonadaceae bacterium]|nr:sulfite exporter TauE/SafE family protein [Gemmatimonadaceae bacterium]
MTIGALGIALALVVGVVLGLLGGGGSILALPIFLYVFGAAPEPAIAMSLAVVGMSAFVGFAAHLQQQSVNLRVGVPFGLCAMVSAFLTARLARHVPDTLQLALFAVFAFSAAAVMLRDSLRPAWMRVGESPTAEPPHFTALVGLEALGVGALTALIGAGGGFVIVPALVYLARVPLKPAVGSSLLIITLNALAAFLGYLGRVPITWSLVLPFTAVAAVGAMLGTRLNRRLPQYRIKQAFALLILVLGTYLIVREIVS